MNRRSRRSHAPRTPVAVLGATGVVGQRLVALLDGHPTLRLEEIVAGPTRTGDLYEDVVPWVLPESIPDRVARMSLLDPEQIPDSPVVLSALPSEVAEHREPELAGAGRIVCTNAASHRLDPDVPLVIPEVNPSDVLRGRRDRGSSGGMLVANPNCVVSGLALALAPIDRVFGIRHATVATLQAISGAGVGGVSAMRIAGNVIPWIPGEEEKIGPELNRILGSDFDVATAVTRVPVVDGHTAHVFLTLDSPAVPSEVERVLGAFRADPLAAGLHSLPDRPLQIHAAPDRPQPRMDAGLGGGMVVSVGRIRAAPPHCLALTIVVHNGIRGAAGGCLANAELCLATGSGGTLADP